MSMKTIKSRALICHQNGKKFYSSILNSSDLKASCYVSRRDEEPVSGFQRALNQTRAKDIARYLDNEKGIIPSPIILSAQEHIDLTFDESSSEISFQLKSHGFLVIDGQHRLYGLHFSERNYDIPVVIFENLKTVDEVSLFVDINTTQKGVPTSLLLDIKHLAGRENSKEEKQRQLFNHLNEDSCLIGLLSSTKSSRGKISKTTFNAATAAVFEDPYFKDKSVEIVYKGVRNYLEASEKALEASKSRRARLTSSIIFKALFAVFSNVIEKTLNEHGNLKVESVQDIIEPISKLDYDSYIGTNKVTQQKVISDMKREINEYDKVSKQLPEDIF